MTKTAEVIKELPINKKRTLVGANLGNGRAEVSLREVRDSLVQNCDGAIGKLRGTRALRLEERVGFYPFLNHLAKAPIVEDEFTARVEEYETARLELAFVHGRQDVIDVILKTSGQMRSASEDGGGK